MPTDFHIGDVVRLRKRHPCGGYEWTVVRVGADIGLCCLTCQRRILLARSELERRLKAFVSRSPTAEPFGGAEGLRGLESPSQQGS